MKKFRHIGTHLTTGGAWLVAVGGVIVVAGLGGVAAASAQGFTFESAVSTPSPTALTPTPTPTTTSPSTPAPTPQGVEPSPGPRDQVDTIEHGPAGADIQEQAGNDDNGQVGDTAGNQDAAGTDSPSVPNPDIPHAPGDQNGGSGDGQ